jgi:hypothetical protein
MGEPLRPCAHLHAYSPDTCRRCQLARDRPGHWDRSVRRRQRQGAARGPGLLRKALNFGKAVARDVLAGRPRVTPGQKAARLAVCEACPQFKAANRSCLVCGCHLDAKAGWAKEDCPEGRWPRLDVIEAPEGPRQIEINANGIGDALLGLTVAAAWKRDNPGGELHYAVRPHVREWVELFGGYDRLITPGSGLPHAWRANNAGAYHFTDAAAKVARREAPPVRDLPPEDLAWAEPYRGRVALAPWSAGEEREWPLARWQEVEQGLLARGARCVVLGARGAPAGGFASPAVLGEPPARVAALVRACRVLVGNESGMAHLAGALGVPCVVLAWTKDGTAIYKPWEKTRVIQAASGAAITPAEVVRAVRPLLPPLPKIAERPPPEILAEAEAAGFPAAELERLFTHRDLRNEDVTEWLARYATLWQVVRGLRPQRIVEIGVRAGYSSWTMLQAAPGASLLAIDANIDPHRGNSHGGYLDAWRHAATINAGSDWQLLVADSHQLDVLPACDAVFIDGDHTLEGCTNDMVLAERSGAKWILLDDYATEDLDVRLAVDQFVRERPHLKGEFRDNGSTGLYLIRLG